MVIAASLLSITYYQHTSQKPGMFGPTELIPTRYKRKIDISGKHVC